VILGLTHVGITVSELDRNIELYCSSFGLKVVSDAPRSGPLFDSVYRAANARARLVYLAVTPLQHFELFHFQNPVTLPASQEIVARPEIQCCVIRLRICPDLSGWSRARLPEWMILPSEEEERIHPDCGAETVTSPDYYFFRIVTDREGGEGRSAGGSGLIYPVVVVTNLQKALAFYQDILGMHSDESTWRENTGCRWKLMCSSWGPSLLLVEPRGRDLLPSHTDRWQRPGYTHIALAVNGIDQFCERLKANGVNLWFAPQELSVGPHAGGKTVFFSSPDGLAVELLDSPLIRGRVRAG
jgi:catechol 2,3-dioxygenase-like lactoylglutathione lyase family enzyme